MYLFLLLMAKVEADEAPASAGHHIKNNINISLFYLRISIFPSPESPKTVYEAVVLIKVLYGSHLWAPDRLTT